jgi:hypothetical protein
MIRPVTKASIAISVIGFATFSGIAACQESIRTRTISDADASRLVRQFVALDSAGKGYLAAANRLFEPCEARVSDQVEPVTRVLLQPSHRSGDTIAVPVEYHIVGYATSHEEREVGPRNWRFRYAPVVQLDTFRVVRDSSGELRIACGPHYGNHPSLTSMEWMSAKLDSASAAAWRRAQRSGQP